MAAGQAAVARATAALFVDGRRAGSAVLVAARYLVTAGHVLARVDPATGANTPVAVEFPGLGMSGEDGSLAASRLDLGAAGARADVAVLDLGKDRPGWLPAPVQLWPASRPPGRVRVFGYPLAEGALNGVWRQFDVAGPAAAGSVQLDWAGDAGSFPGHSGGPAIDADEGTLAGILVEGAERGRFDRYVPVTVIAQAWPQLPRPWMVTGVDRSEARSHFTRRSLGQRSVARGGDLFRGRQVGLDRIKKWLTMDEPPGVPLVVTGQPGAGKSAVLARAVLSAEAEQRGPGLAFHARAATSGDFLTALADVAGVDAPATPDNLLASLATLTAQKPIPVAVDALDEAASDQDVRQLAEVLAELAVLPGLRVVVASRPLTAGNPYAPGGLLPMLGVTADDAPNLINLDSDAYFDALSLRQFAAALLAQEGTDHPGPPGAAWTRYRDQPAVCARLAGVIAERAARNFLVAAMAAVPLSIAHDMTDPAAPGFDPPNIPSGVGEALAKYLDQLPGQRREHDRALLTALAYARGAGLDDPTWLAFAGALGYPATIADLDTLRHSAAADYLLQTATERRTRPVTRLFHQALTDELLAARYQPGDESLLLDMLVSRAGATSWEDWYAREHAADHATAAGRLDELLDDPLYLVSADPARLVPYLDTARSAAARAEASVYRQIAHHLTAREPPMRASQLELTAHLLGYRSLALRVTATAAGRPWQTRWSRGQQAAGHQVLTGHEGAVYAVAVGALPDGTPVAVTGGADRTVRVWRLADGTPVGQPLRGHTGLVAGVAVGALVDGTPVVVSGSYDDTVRVWRLADGTPVGQPLRGHTGKVMAVAVAVLADGTPVAVSGGFGKTLRVWRLTDDDPAGEPLLSHACDADRMAVGALEDGTLVAVSGGSSRIARVWRLADGSPVGAPMPMPDGGMVYAVAMGALPDGSPVAVTGGSDGTVQVWRLPDGLPALAPLRAHIGDVFAVAVGALANGTPVAVSGGADQTVRLWRLADGIPAGEPLHGHDGQVNALAAGALADGRPVIVSGGDDRTVRVWRLADGTAAGESLHGHDGNVYAVATAILADGTPVAVSGGDDGTVRVWRLADGTPVGEPMRHGRFVHAVAAGALADGTAVVVSGGDDEELVGTVRVWRLADGMLVRELRDRGAWAVAVGALADGTPVAVTAGLDGTARVWRLPDGAPVGDPTYGYSGGVRAVAVGELPDGTPVAVVCGMNDSSLRVWRLADGTPVSEPLRGHEGRVHAVAIGALADGSPAVVSGGGDGTIRLWRLPDGTPVGKPLPAHDGGVHAVAVRTLADGSPAVFSGGGDGMLRVWRLADQAPLIPPLNLSRLVYAVAVHDTVIVSVAGSHITVTQPAGLMGLSSA